jgi:hypothetical protein
METFPAELVEQPVQNRTGRNSPVPKERRGAGQARPAKDLHLKIFNDIN